MTFDFFLAVNGRARSGKDTVSQRLVESHGFTKVAFADPLRRFAEAVNPPVSIVMKDVLDDRGKWVQRPEFYRYNDAVGEVGYEAAKDLYPELRSMLQKVGTEGARGTFWDNFWVDLAERRVLESGDSRVVFSDCRFENEARWASTKGFVCRVVRPSLHTDESTHASEQDLDWPFDFTIINDGTIEDLYDKVDFMMGTLEERWSKRPLPPVGARDRLDGDR